VVGKSGRGRCGDFLWVAGQPEATRGVVLCDKMFTAWCKVRDFVVGTGKGVRDFVVGSTTRSRTPPQSPELPPARVWAAGDGLGVARRSHTC
jgi:hypothetical protein